MKNKNFFIYFINTIVFLFTLLILKYISDSKLEYEKISEKILFQQASTLYNNMITVEKWASGHGEIYIKAKDDLKPNPFIENNHTYTKDEELLIKINSSWMIREISNISNKNENYYFKLTSLNPINPLNIPDNFEKLALKYLEENKNESYFTSLENNKYNFFSSFFVDNSCLNCHTNKEYKIGDKIGGLRVSIPIDYYKEKVEIINSKATILYFVTIFTSIVFIVIITFAINSIYVRELSIVKLNKTLENKVNQRTKELKKANKKLLEVSLTDYLTNLPNRRHFFEIGQKAFHLAKRENKYLSVICIDIDFFKQINDYYGHQVGDEILKLLSNIMSKNIRKSDIVARTGGEEFTILLNNSDENNALIIAEKLRTSIENASYKKDNYEVKTTISLGISQLRDDDNELDSIISRADKALYIAKKNNRNKSVIYHF